jgi:hypothetical protein
VSSKPYLNVVKTLECRQNLKKIGISVAKTLKSGHSRRQNLKKVGIAVAKTLKKMSINVVKTLKKWL